jgi:CAAX protease family protein
MYVGRRSALRVTFFWGGYMGILLLGSIPRNMVPPKWGQTVWALWGAALVFGLTQLFVRREGRSLADVGLTFSVRSLRRFAIGALAGVVLYGSNIAAVSAAAGGIHVVRSSSVGAGVWALTVFTYVASACMEGFGFRGYPLHTLLRPFGPWPAVVTTAAAFALSHVAFGWPWDQVLFGVFPNGLLFGVVAIASGGLAMPIALHAAINVTQWSLSQGGAAGPWQIVVEPGALSRVAARAPVAALVVYAAAILMVWRWRSSFGMTWQ